MLCCFPDAIPAVNVIIMYMFTDHMTIVLI